MTRTTLVFFSVSWAVVRAEDATPPIQEILSDDCMDTELRSGMPETNYGARPDLGVDLSSSSGEKQALLQCAFALAKGATVLSAVGDADSIREQPVDGRFERVPHDQRLG